MTPDELAKYEERKAKAKSRRDKWKSRRESYEAKAGSRLGRPGLSHEGSQAFTEATTLTLSDPGAEDVLRAPCVARAERDATTRARVLTAGALCAPSGGTQARHQPIMPPPDSDGEGSSDGSRRKGMGPGRSLRKAASKATPVCPASSRASGNRDRGAEKRARKRAPTP